MMTRTPSAAADAAQRPPVDLPAYFARVGYTGPAEPTAAVLAALHLAHATHIPFENCDILLGRPIRLDLDSLQAKLVRGGRGGYCFEQNLLLAAVLEQIGFSVTRLAARVRYRATRVLPRTHMVALVRIDDAGWLADVGFGAEGLLLPVPFEPGRLARQFAWTYRLNAETGRWVLQSLHGADWVDLYAFTLEPQEVADYEMASHYVSTHPDSRFVQTLTAQRMTIESRQVLRNGELVESRGAASTVRRVGDDEMLAVLATTFGLSFPPGTRFHYRVPSA